MNANMGLTYNEQKRVYRFVNNNPPAREIFLTPEEVNFIVNSRKRERWYNDLRDQIEYEDGNIDFSTISPEEFVIKCLDDIEERLEIYGEDFYDPDVEEIVFDVANDNGMWRDA